jgi:hypothetical protein
MAKSKVKKPSTITTRKALEKLEAIEEKRAALHAAILRAKATLVESQNALRVVEQAIGGKLVTKPKHSI